MARNLKRDYLKKLASIETNNGYKVDIANYVYNPSHEHEYPTLRKKTSETDTELTFTAFEYFKYYDGTGEYLKKEYTFPNNGETWNIAKSVKETVLEKSNRFSLNKLIELAQA